MHASHDLSSLLFLPVTINPRYHTLPLAQSFDTPHSPKQFTHPPLQSISLVSLYIYLYMHVYLHHLFQSSLTPHSQRPPPRYHQDRGGGPPRGGRGGAPQPLDHFRRGYRERATMRDNAQYRPPAGRGGAGGVPPRGREPRSWNRRQGGAGGDRDFPTARGEGGGSASMQGFNASEWMDRLCHGQQHPSDTLAEAQSRYPDAFQSGRAMTALIAAAGRRRQIRLAFACWDFMDQVGLEKNTYHYNAMISVAEKSKNLRHALDLLKEMDQRGIEKNEVT